MKRYSIEITGFSLSSSETDLRKVMKWNKTVLILLRTLYFTKSEVQKHFN